MAYRVAHGYLPPPKGRGIDTISIRSGRGWPQAPKPPSSTRPNRTNRQRVIARAVESVATAIENANPELSAAQARHYAQVALTRPGVELGAGKKGMIFYQGKRYAPAAFGKIPLISAISGATARAKNQAALNANPDYQAALAQLGLARDQSTAGLADQERQALIQYGDPTFAGDALTAGAAAENPFSTQRLERQAYDQNLLQAQQRANQLGVASGGGAISGQQAAQRQYAADTQDQVSKLQQLLAQVAGQQAAAQQAYSVGQQQAATAAYNAMLQSGYNAAVAPNYGVGRFQLRQPSRAVKGMGGNGGGGGGGLPPVAIGTGKPIVGPQPYQGGSPPTFANPALPPRTPTVPPVGGVGGVDLQSVYRRLGIFG